MSSINSSSGGMADWAKNQHEQMTDEKIKQSVKDAEKTKKIEIANSAMSILSKVRLPQ